MKNKLEFEQFHSAFPQTLGQTPYIKFLQRPGGELKSMFSDSVQQFNLFNNREQRKLMNTDYWEE